MWNNFHIRIQFRDEIPDRVDFRLSDAVLGVEQLAVQVCDLDVIVIDDADGACRGFA